MAEAGCVGDARCGEALDLLEAKRLADGMFACEDRRWRLGERLEGARGRSMVDWGVVDGRSCNEFVTVEAVYVLREAGRV